MENFKLLALKVVAVMVTGERWSLTRGSKYSDLTQLETFGILENWSLKRVCRLQEVVATAGSTASCIILNRHLGQSLHTIIILKFYISIC